MVVVYRVLVNSKRGKMTFVSCCPDKSQGSFPRFQIFLRPSFSFLPFKSATPRHKIVPVLHEAMPCVVPRFCIRWILSEGRFRIQRGAPRVCRDTTGRRGCFVILPFPATIHEKLLAQFLAGGDVVPLHRFDANSASLASRQERQTSTDNKMAGLFCSSSPSPNPK